MLRRLTRLALASTAVGLAVGALPITAQAQTDASGGATDTGGEVIVEHQSPGGDGAGTGSGGRSKSCRFYELASEGAATPWSIGPGDAVTAPVEIETQVWAVCTWTDTGASAGPPTIVTLFPRDPREVALELVERARRQLDLPLPAPAFNPPSDKIIVNVETWLWVDTSQRLAASAAGWGVTATLTATPVRTIWRLGDGRSVTCDGSGTAYDRTRPSVEQRSECVHTYRDAVGLLDVDVTQVWRLRWSATNGQQGDLGEVVRSTDASATVREIEIVLRHR